jgi:hypothetical protein
VSEEQSNLKNILIGVGVVVICIVAVVLSLPKKTNITSAGQAYYSDDDGASWFADDADKVVPFDHGGKQAVKALVFECGGKKFVARLERMTAQKQRFVQDAAAAAKAGAAPPPTPPGAGPFDWGIEAKKPGDARWIASSDLKRFAPLLQVSCADGGTPEPVLP